MIELPEWVALVALVALSAIALFARTWIKATAESSAKHIFEAEIEKVKSEFRQSEERLRVDLQRRESEIASLRERVLSGRANRIALLDQRRIVAVENIQKCVGILSRLKMPSLTLATFKMDVIAERAPKEANLRQILKTFVDATPNFIEKLSQAQADHEKPFITKMAWALYSGYSVIIVRGYATLNVLASGLDDPLAMLKDDTTADLIKVILNRPGSAGGLGL